MAVIDLNSTARLYRGGDTPIMRRYRGDSLIWTTLDLHQPVADTETTLFSAHSFLLTGMFPIAGYDHGGILDDLRSGSILYTFLPGSSEMARWNAQGPEVAAVGDLRLVVALFGSQTAGLWPPTSTEGQEQYQALYFYIKDAWNKGRREIGLWVPWAGGAYDFDADSSAGAERIRLKMEEWVPGMKVSLLPAHLLVRDIINYMAANGLGSPYGGDNFHLDETGEAPSGLSHLIQAWLSTRKPAADPGDSALMAYMKERVWYWLTNWAPCGMGGAITVTPWADTTPIVTPTEPPSSGGGTAPSFVTVPSITPATGTAGQVYTLDLGTYAGDAPITPTWSLTHSVDGDVTGSVVAGEYDSTGATAGTLTLSVSLSNAAGTAGPETDTATVSAVPTGPTPLAEITAAAYTGPALSAGALPAASGGFRTFTAGASSPVASIPVSAGPQVYMIAAMRTGTFSNLVYCLSLQNGSYGTWPGVIMAAYGAIGDWVGGMVDGAFSDANAVAGSSLPDTWQIVEVWADDGTVSVSVDNSTPASVTTGTDAAWAATQLHLFRDEGSGGHAIDMAAMRIFDEIPADRAAQRAWATGELP